jgi:hypothetical protein
MPRGHVIVFTSVAAALTLAVLACGLTADFSGLQGGVRDSGAGDAGIDADAGMDAGADVRVDTGVDAGIDADACVAVPSYCDSLSVPPLFCSDFDNCGFPAPWTDARQAGGLLSLDSNPNDVVSAPRSLVAEDYLNAAQTDSADLRAILRAVPAPPSTLTYEFSLQQVAIDSSVDGPRLVVAAVDFLSGSDAGTDYHLQFTVVRNGSTINLYLEELAVSGACPLNSHLMNQPLTQNAWTDVRLTVKRFSSTPGTASVSFGTRGDAGPPTVVLPDTALCINVEATQLQFGIGSLYKTPLETAWKNRFDNVRFDVVPGP